MEEEQMYKLSLLRDPYSEHSEAIGSNTIFTKHNKTGKSIPNGKAGHKNQLLTAILL